MDFKENIIYELPVVVTRGFTLVLKESVNLGVEREFSLKAIKDSKENFESYCVVVPQINPSEDEITSLDQIYKIGTISKIVSCDTSTNPVNVKIAGLQRIEIHELNIDQNGCKCKCTLKKDVYGSPSDENQIVRSILSIIESVEADKLFKAPFKDKEILSRGVSSGQLIYFFLKNLNISNDEKQRIYEIDNTNDRLIEILGACSTLARMADVDKKIQAKLEKNSEQQQKEYFLREKMRAIKQELGEDSKNDSSNILEKIKNGNYPQEVKEKITDEIKRKELMPQGSLENSLIQDYIDIVLSIPWSESTIDNDNVEHAKHVLDEDHYGLEKVKERIIEYLCVKKVKNNLKAPILCFYGPPGCGKTSLSRSVARALNRKFVKCSLGGISDEGEIRGHRRTYVGSRPGRIINLLRKVKVNNPVFLLDEIDKLSRDSFKGDPASALLEVLDPEQNKQFTDNYLELGYDLSNVLFICTANNIENIPAPLLDRLELIHVPSYTSIDKLHIAKDFLIRKELEANGLNEKAITFDDDAIFYIIDRYTREAGVRSLERNIASVIRKIIVKNIDHIKEEDFSVNVSENDVNGYLGLEVYDSTEKEKGKQVGVVTGLAYTEYGGDILPIEVNYFKGAGKLALTGKLGEVMKESCQIALDYVKANAEKYDIDASLFEKNDIHIHVPEGAVPKDGPSAGIAITIALISAFSKKPVSGDIAMTGEVTLRGNAIPIGGLREKSLAALRCGIKKIIIPEGNRRTVSELPKEVTEKLKISFMKNVDDACKIIFK